MPYVTNAPLLLREGPREEEEKEEDGWRRASRRLSDYPREPQCQASSRVAERQRLTLQEQPVSQSVRQAIAAERTQLMCNAGGLLVGERVGLATDGWWDSWLG